MAANGKVLLIKCKAQRCQAKKQIVAREKFFGKAANGVVDKPRQAWNARGRQIPK